MLNTDVTHDFAQRWYLEGIYVRTYVRTYVLYVL